MKKILLSLITVISIGYSARLWFVCQKFIDQFYFSSLDLQLRMVEAIHTDSQTPLFFVRFFHNKLTGSLIDVFRSYVLYYDVRFLLSLVGFTGFICALAGVYYLLVERKHKLLYVFLMLFFVFPFLSIFFRSIIPYQVWLIGFSLIVSVLSIYGIYRLKWNTWLLSVFVLSLLVTIWYQSIYTPLVLRFCML